MLRRSAVAAAVLVLLFGTAGEAQTPPPAAARPLCTRQDRCEETSGQSQGRRKAAGLRSRPVLQTRCISALGDRFSVHKFGLTVFETEDNEVPVEGWGFDDLAVARVRAATVTILLCDG